MKAIPMKLVGIINTAVLFLLLGTTAPVYAQHEEHAQKSKPAEHAQGKQEAKQIPTTSVRTYAPARSVQAYGEALVWSEKRAATSSLNPNPHISPSKRRDFR